MPSCLLCPAQVVGTARPLSGLAPCFTLAQMRGTVVTLVKQTSLREFVLRCVLIWAINVFLPLKQHITVFFWPKCVFIWIFDMTTYNKADSYSLLIRRLTKKLLVSKQPARLPRLIKLIGTILSVCYLLFMSLLLLLFELIGKPICHRNVVWSEYDSALRWNKSACWDWAVRKAERQVHVHRRFLILPDLDHFLGLCGCVSSAWLTSHIISG